MLFLRVSERNEGTRLSALLQFAEPQHNSSQRPAATWTVRVRIITNQGTFPKGTCSSTPHRSPPIILVPGATFGRRRFALTSQFLSCTLSVLWKISITQWLPFCVPDVISEFRSSFSWEDFVPLLGWKRGMSAKEFRGMFPNSQVLTRCSLIIRWDIVLRVKEERPLG